MSSDEEGLLLLRGVMGKDMLPGLVYDGSYVTREDLLVCKEQQ